MILEMIVKERTRTVQGWSWVGAVMVLALVAPAAAQEAGSANGQAGENAALSAAAAEFEIRYEQPSAMIADFLHRDPNYAVLNAPSPDGRYFLVPRATQLSTLEQMAEPTYRLAELELRPATDRLWHLDTFGLDGLRIYDMQAQQFRDVAVPAGAYIGDLIWSPDGSRVAFLAHLPAGTEVWTADAATGEASRFAEGRVLATLATSVQVNTTQAVNMRTPRILQWTPQGTLLTLMVPADRGAEPARPRVPAAPTMRMTRPEPTASRTLPNLLRDPHDADLFEHYTRAQLVELAPGQAPRPIGEPRMYDSIRLSPDGRHVLATFYERPFSFIARYTRFPSRTVVLDAATGGTSSTLAVNELREGRGSGNNLRSLAWRPDGAGLTYLRRSDGADHVMLIAEPYDTTNATLVARSDDQIRSIAFSPDANRAFATVRRSGRDAIVHWDLQAPDAAGEGGPQRQLLVDFHGPNDLFELPGTLWTESTPNGVDRVIVSTADDAVYLRGDGFQEDYRPQPFVDRVDLASGERTRVFEGAKTSWDQPLVALDPDLQRMIVSRESVDLFPDSYLRTADGAFQNLTQNVDPFPEIQDVRRIDFSFDRRDGLEVRGRVSLPIGYRDGDRVPAIFWTYPREYTTPEAYTRAAYRARNLNAYTHMTWLRWSDLWLTQGYALVYPDIPIIGENYNDTYISNMVDAMYGALRAVDALGHIDMDRIGHGGHSYGAFATANLLAHTPFFRAGIGGAGAYNRSLTPFGFQAESRDLWSAPNTYLEISPFFTADQINTPLLMYHGGDDNNTGTWPIQSERFMEALVNLGKDAVLYVYPFESHTIRAMENKLDMWARWIDWFDLHVKEAGARVEVAPAPTEGEEN